MATFQRIVEDIRDLKIQGAENVAKAGIDALSIVADKNKSRGDFTDVLKKAETILIKTRPTEPCMRNSLGYVLSDIEKEEDAFEVFKKRALSVKRHFEHTDEKIAQIGAKKIVDKGIVFTHCHSSTVIRILKKAKKNRRRFHVHNTETRPFFQGRITAKELARAGIPVVHYVDSAARLALKKADIMLIGADAITSEGKVINKIGSELFAEVADRYGVPVYVCADSWKFDPKTVFGYETEIEKRPVKEVWPTAPRGVLIDNHAFEKIDSDLITGVISELGIYRPEVFVQEVKRVYPWIM